MALAAINVKRPACRARSKSLMHPKVLPDSNKKHKSTGYAKQKHNIHAFALSGRGYYIFVSHTQGAASLALGYALLWAFSPPRVPLALGWQRNAFLRRTANSHGFRPFWLRLPRYLSEGEDPRQYANHHQPHDQLERKTHLHVVNRLITTG